MSRAVSPSRAAAALAFAAALALPAPAAILPAWSLIGAYDVPVDVGFRNVAAQYAFTLEGFAGNLTLRYDGKGGLGGGGSVDGDGGTSFLAFRGTFAVGTDGVQRLVVEEASKRPGFRFEGAVEDGTGHVSGTYTRAEGFAGFAGTGAGPLVLTRTPPSAPERTFRFFGRTTMDRKGKVRNGLSQDQQTEDRARLFLFNGVEVRGGKVSGRLKTDAEGATTAKVVVKGDGWKMKLAGPVDADGFRATADIVAGGFRVTGASVLLPVQDGPDPPPPPPPPPPKNLVSGATARSVGGQVTISRRNVAEKFFGAPAEVTLVFPTSLANQPFHADPSSFQGLTPRRFSVRIGSRTYQTETAPGDVSVTFRRYDAQAIEATCTGTVVDDRGRTKTVDLILQATVE